MEAFYRNYMILQDVTPFTVALIELLGEVVILARPTLGQLECVASGFA